MYPARNVALIRSVAFNRHHSQTIQTHFYSIESNTSMSCVTLLSFRLGMIGLPLSEAPFMQDKQESADRQED